MDAEDEELAALAAGIESATQALHRQPTWTAALEAVVDHAVRTVQGAEHAGVTATRGRGYVTLAASDDLPEKVDSAQYELDEGPCVDAVTQNEIFRGEDLVDDPRWPRFSVRAEALGVRSMLSIPLFSQERRQGALNLYAAMPGAFDENAEATAVIYAAHATLGLARAEGNDSRQQLEEALERSRTVGTAVGILMATRGVTRERAMTLLREASQRLNSKVTELAETVVYTGELPTG